MAHLLSVNVGLPRDIAWQGKTVHTAIWKAPVYLNPQIAHGALNPIARGQ